MLGKAEFTMANGIALEISGDYQHRIFERTIAGVKRQDRILSSGGINFAGLIHNQGRIKIDKLFVGAEWLSVQEGGADDVSKLSLLPKLAISVQF